MGGMKKVQSILVAVDFSACSKHALEYALSLAEQLGATVDVLHVWASPAYVSPHVALFVEPGAAPVTLEQVARNEADRSMNKFMESFPNAKLTIRQEFGTEVDTIVSAAKRFDLLIMGTHGRSALERVVLGSVAERVLRRSTTPALVIREPS
jgi:nucleotide-binding universal stress UspA family protein